MGEGSDYQKMLSDAKTATQSTAQDVQQAAKRIEGFQQGLQGFASTALQGLAAVGLGGGLMSLFNDFAEAEQGEMRLRAALASNGREVEALMGRYNRFAQEMQRTTVIDDDAALGLLRTAETMGLTGAAAERAARNAIALSSARDIDASSAVRLTAALEHGNAEMLRRHIPAIRGVEDATEQATIAQRELGRMFSQAGAVAQSSRGQMQQLGNAFGNLKEELGAVVAAALMPIVNALKQAVEWFQSLSPVVKQVAVGLIGLAGAAVSLGPLLMVFRLLRGSLIGLLGTVMGFAASPIGLLFVAAIPLIALFVQHMGGVEEAWAAVQEAAGEAWDWIQERFQAFMDWAAPVLDALGGFLTAVWERLLEAAKWVVDTVTDIVEMMGDAISSVFEFFGTDAGTVLEDIQTTLRDTFMYGEFLVRNFGAHVEVAWLGIQFGFVTAVDFLRTQFANLVGIAWGAVNAVGSLFSGLWDAILGEATLDELGDRIAAGFQEGFDVASEALGAGESELARELGAELEAASSRLAEGWQEFRDARLAATDPSPAEERAAVRDAENAGEDVAAAMTRGVKKEMGKLDSILFRSAEAVSRFQDHMDRLQGERASARPEAASPIRGAESASRVASIVAPPPSGRDSRMVVLLQSIDNHLAALAGRPSLTIREADIG